MQAADEIFGAHIEAGHYVRDLLEARLDEADLIGFNSQIRIELAKGDGGELSLFRVLSVSEEEFMVDEDTLGEPFPIQETSWLA